MRPEQLVAALHDILQTPDFLARVLKPDGKLTLADMQGIEIGSLSENVRLVIKTPIDGE